MWSSRSAPPNLSEQVRARGRERLSCVWLWLWRALANSVRFDSCDSMQPSDRPKPKQRSAPQAARPLPPLAPAVRAAAQESEKEKAARLAAMRRMYGLAAGPEGSEEVDSAMWSTVREAALPSPLTTENRRRDQDGMVPLGTLGYSRAESPSTAQPAGRVRTVCEANRIMRPQPRVIIRRRSSRHCSCAHGTWLRLALRGTTRHAFCR